MGVSSGRIGGPHSDANGDHEPLVVRNGDGRLSSFAPENKLRRRVTMISKRML